MRFFTTQPILIRKTPQEEIDAMIEKVVPMKEIKVALLQLLCRNNSKRPSFEEFLTFDALSSEHDIEAMMTQSAEGYLT